MGCPENLSTWRGKTQLVTQWNKHVSSYVSRSIIFPHPPHQNKAHGSTSGHEWWESRSGLKLSLSWCIQGCCEGRAIIDIPPPAHRILPSESEAVCDIWHRCTTLLTKKKGLPCLESPVKAAAFHPVHPNKGSLCQIQSSAFPAFSLQAEDFQNALRLKETCLYVFPLLISHCQTQQIVCQYCTVSLATHHVFSNVY